MNKTLPNTLLVSRKISNIIQTTDYIDENNENTEPDTNIMFYVVSGRELIDLEHYCYSSNTITFVYNNKAKYYNFLHKYK